MAVAVEQDAPRAEVAAAQRAVVDRLDQQLLDEPRARRDAAVAEQLHVLLAQRQQARRLDAGDRSRSPASRSVSASALALRVVEQALGDRRAPAAARRSRAARRSPPASSSSIAARPTPGSVNVVNESARKTTSPRAPALALPLAVRPADQRLALEARQRAAAVDARELLQQPTRNGQVRQRRGRAAERG